jgi:hypothetical protein
MCFQISRFSESFVANFADVWFITSMGSHVDFQDIISSKFFSTYLAYMWSLVTMFAHIVVFQMTLCRKSFLADFTLKRFDPIMAVNMIL